MSEGGGLASASGGAASKDDVIQFSDPTEKAIQGMCRSSLFSGDDDLTAQINALFPTEQSLSQIDSVMSCVEGELADLDAQLADLVQGHADALAHGQHSLTLAHEAMVELEARIEAIRSKTRSSDEVVREMTRDIKQLDVAKRNLTASITTLHHLHILLTGVDDIAVWVDRRDYASIARQLPAVLNVLHLFDGFATAEQISRVARRLEGIKQRLTLQLATDIKHAFQSGELSESVTDMCRVAAALEGNVKDNLCKWLIDQQLAEYSVLYAENEQLGWVDKIDERYKWYVRRLTDFERSGVAAVFPADWEMGRRLTAEFCSITKSVLSRMLSRRRQDVEWKLLAHAIQHTRMFEALLVKRFPAKAEYNFDRAIWCVFDPFLDVFIAAQEKTLNEFLEGCANKIRCGEERPCRESCAHAVPLPSSADMFLLLKKVVTESSKLASQPDALLKDVVGVIKTCLRGYAHGCLTAFLPQVGGGGASGGGAASASTLFQLIRDDSAPVRLTPDQQFFACCILATADWCAETTLQLQEKLQQRQPGLDLNAETEHFYSLANQALATLVHDAEATCDAALQAMTRISWNVIEGVGDESPFVASLKSHLRSAVPQLRDLLTDRRKYFAHLCMKLATQLSHKYVGAVFRCRPLSTHGAEQLLLDTHSLKTFLLSLPSAGSAVQAKPPSAYTSAVNQAMTKAEMVLKLVMSDARSPEAFAENYVRMLPESDANELQKVLEMRGMKRAEQTSFVSAWRAAAGVTVDDTAPAAGLSSIGAMGGVAMGGAYMGGAQAAAALSNVMSRATEGLRDNLSDTSMRRLEKLVKKL